ncbi:MAG: CarD family transcriptional regulator [Firmicutes bacterium]|nr:CarD family transcriptional regulator [Bacillota bacterium]
MFSVNDTVLYGASGVCVISDIEKRTVCGKNHSYYVLNSVYRDNSTILVPVDNDTLVGKMRRVLSQDEIAGIISEVLKNPMRWEDDERMRKEHYKVILSAGDSLEMVKQMKNIHIHKKELEDNGKKLHLADERFFKDAERVIGEEFSLVLKADPEDIMNAILQKFDSEST